MADSDRRRGYGGAPDGSWRCSPRACPHGLHPHQESACRRFLIPYGEPHWNRTTAAATSRVYRRTPVGTCRAPLRRLSLFTKRRATHVYRRQSIQTRPPTNPSNAARRIDPDPMTAPAPPLPDWVASIRDRKRGTASGRTIGTTIHRIAVRSQSECRNQPQSGSASRRL
jgi:hypothetical protein